MLAGEVAVLAVDCYRGTEEYCGVKGKVDIINSTFGKALGGAAGLLCLVVSTDYPSCHNPNPNSC